MAEGDDLDAGETSRRRRGGDPEQRALARAELLVGRALEQRVLEGAWRQALARRPRAILLTGLPGSGKSALAEALAARVAGQATVVRFPIATRPRRGAGPPRDRAITASIRAAQRSGDPHRRFESWTQACADLRRAATRQPILLLADDLERAPDSQLALLGFLLRELCDAAVMPLLCSGDRIGATPRTSRRLAALARQCTRVSLRGLGPGSTRALFAEIAGAPPSPRLAAALHEQTAGHPALVIEWARAHAPGSGVEPPPAVLARVRRWLPERLPGIRFAAKVAACGASFRAPDVARALGTGPEASHAGVGSLVERGLVEPIAARAGWYRFRHPLLARVLSDHVDARARRALEARLAELRAPAGPGEDPGLARAVAASRAEGLRAAPAAEERFEMTIQGSYWQLRRAERCVRVRDSRGLRHLAALVASPGHVLRAVDLSDTPDGDAGDLLDRRAVAEYRRRRAALVRSLADPGLARGAADALRHELGFLERELSRAVGLGGRLRRAGSGPERARVRVTRGIRRAIARIAEQDPELGRWLDTSVTTGHGCVYRAAAWPATAASGRGAADRARSGTSVRS
jgi:hypothetical protein